ncbi:MAG: hypothetical protein KGH62_01205, partial [Candidatus Micrarchaeota archaeon]|nr:hypothetical protein [Candidatus Micrarchaeota archaeon]
YYESPWAGYNGTYFATTYREGTLVATGNLTSNPFVVTEPYLNFKVVSPQNNFLYVEILHNGAPALTVHLNTYSVQGNLNSTSTFQNASILMVPFLCQNVQIRIVADVVGTTENTYQFIAVTNFTQAKRPILTQGIIVNQTYS